MSELHIIRDRINLYLDTNPARLTHMNITPYITQNRKISHHKTYIFCLSRQVLQIHNTHPNWYCKRNSDEQITQLGKNFFFFKTVSTRDCHFKVLWFGQASSKSSHLLSGRLILKLSSHIEGNILSKFYLFTNWCCLKNNIKIYIKTTPTCFSVTITPSSGSALIYAY